MTSTLPPAQAEAMARIIGPVAWELRETRLRSAEVWRGRVGPEYSQQTCDFMATRMADEAEAVIAPSLAKAQAAWAASPGPSAYEALEPFAVLCEHVDDLANETGGSRRPDRLATWVEGLGWVHWRAFRTARTVFARLQGGEEG